MPIIEWNQSFHLGIEPFDEHHRNLVALINESFDGFILGADTEKLGELFDRLTDYASYHFACEERWMSERGYPELAPHQAEHRAFSSRVSRIKEDFQQGRGDLSREVFSFLVDWISEHVLSTDTKYRKYCTGDPAGARETGASP